MKDDVAQKRLLLVCDDRNVRVAVIVLGPADEDAHRGVDVLGDILATRSLECGHLGTSCDCECHGRRRIGQEQRPQLECFLPSQRAPRRVVLGGREVSWIHDVGIAREHTTTLGEVQGRPKNLKLFRDRSRVRALTAALIDVVPGRSGGPEPAHRRLVPEDANEVADLVPVVFDGLGSSVVLGHT